MGNIEKPSSNAVKDCLKEIIESPNWSIGAIDQNKEEAIVLYANRRELAPISKFSYLQTYSMIPFTLLLRWTKNYSKAEEKANSIYELLNKGSFFIDGFDCFTSFVCEGPIDLGPSDEGVYRFSIEFNLYFKKKGVV